MSETSVVTELSDAEILGLKLSDLHYYGFYWEKNPDKPILIIRIQPQNAPLQELVCDWAANLKSAMEYKMNHGGLCMASSNFRLRLESNIIHCSVIAMNSCRA
jgi:hypothetical protein